MALLMGRRGHRRRRASVGIVSAASRYRRPQLQMHPRLELTQPAQSVPMAGLSVPSSKLSSSPLSWRIRASSSTREPESGVSSGE